MLNKKSKKSVEAKKNKLKLPSSWELFKKTWLEISTFWRPISGVLIVYGILYYLLVMGLSVNLTLQNQVQENSGKILNALSTLGNVFSNGSLIGNNQSDSTGLFQFLLLLIASMAFVWTLRKLQALKKIKIREAYYLGTATLIPAILVSIIMLLTLLPGSIGSSILSIALQASGSDGELLIITAITLLLLVLSVYLFVMIWPSFYIVTLPQTKPMTAIKSAAKITKHNRLALIRKITMLGFVMLLVLFMTLFVVALIYPPIVAFTALIILLIIFGVSHIYLYNLYRSLI